MSQPQKIMVAMSGGVDSSAAAAMLHEQGYSVVGVTLHLWDAQGDQKVGRCCAPEDQEDARRTCENLGVPHYVLDERQAFRDQVVDPFVRSYEHGETPSPCVHCNRTVKLLKLVELADELGASHVATGHYARIDAQGNPPRLFRGADRQKDQSYFLFGLPAKVLRRLIFPLGAMTKEQVRAEAVRLRVPNATKPESQELCFVPDGNVGDFVARRGQGARRGRVVDEAGQVLAVHDGVANFTVGQRRGLGVGGGARPRYVLRIVGDTDDVVVGPKEQLAGSGLRARDAHWLTKPGDAFEASVRIRYRHEPAKALVRVDEAGAFSASFFEPQRAITPGQAAVVYSGDTVLGGGFIV